MLALPITTAPRTIAADAATAMRQPVIGSHSHWSASIVALFAGLKHERIQFLLHDSTGEHVGSIRFDGDASSASFDTLVVLRTAIVREAASILVAHNHPSGQAIPSHGDCEETRNIALACRAVGLRLSDHLIVAGDDIFSFRDNGLL